MLVSLPSVLVSFPWVLVTFPWVLVSFPWVLVSFPWVLVSIPWRLVSIPWRLVSIPWVPVNIPSGPLQPCPRGYLKGESYGTFHPTVRIQKQFIPKDSQGSLSIVPVFIEFYFSGRRSTPLPGALFNQDHSSTVFIEFSSSNFSGRRSRPLPGPLFDQDHSSTSFHRVLLLQLERKPFKTPARTTLQPVFIEFSSFNFS